MNREQYGVMMYGPQRWAAIKAANGQQLGWTISTIGSGILNIGKTALDWWSDSKKTSVYKDVAAQATLERQQIVNNVLKWGAILAIGVVAVKALKD